MAYLVATTFTNNYVHMHTHAYTYIIAIDVHNFCFSLIDNYERGQS